MNGAQATKRDRSIWKRFLFAAQLLFEKKYLRVQKINLCPDSSSNTHSNPSSLHPGRALQVQQAATSRNLMLNLSKEQDVSEECTQHTRDAPVRPRTADGALGLLSYKEIWNQGVADEVKKLATHTSPFHPFLNPCLHFLFFEFFFSSCFDHHELTPCICSLRPLSAEAAVVGELGTRPTRRWTAAHRCHQAKGPHSDLVCSWCIGFLAGLSDSVIKILQT